MNNRWILYGVYFILIVLLQGLVVNHLGIGVYAYPMIYILLLIILPFEVNFILSLGIAIAFGLHTSASLWLAFMRPTILKTLKPRDGYEVALMPTTHDMGITWYTAYAGIMIVIHHIWFFTLEVFRFDLLGLILLKIIVSAILSLLIILGLQVLLFKSSK